MLDILATTLYLLDIMGLDIFGLDILGTTPWHIPFDWMIHFLYFVQTWYKVLSMNIMSGQDNWVKAVQVQSNLHLKLNYAPGKVRH